MNNKIIIGVVVIALILALLGVYFYNSDEIATKTTEITTEKIITIDNNSVNLQVIEEGIEVSSYTDNPSVNFEEYDMEAMMEMEAQLMADGSVFVEESNTSVENVNYNDGELLTDADTPPLFPVEVESLTALEDTYSTESDLNNIYDEEMMEAIPDGINESKDDNYYTDTDTSQDFLMDMDDIDISKENLEVIDNPQYTEDELNEIYEDMDTLGDNKQ